MVGLHLQGDKIDIARLQIVAKFRDDTRKQGENTAFEDGDCDRITDESGKEDFVVCDFDYLLTFVASIECS